MSSLTGAALAAVQLGLGSLLVRPRRSVGPFALQITVQERHTDEMEITDHPIEQGATISDHAFKRPSEVTIEGSWSASPSSSGLVDGIIGGLKATVTGAQAIVSGKPPTSMQEMYDKLLRLQKEAIPFDIYTGKRKYSNMVMRSLSVTTDKTTENNLAVTMVCRELLIVQTSVLNIQTDLTKQSNPGATASPVNSGTKSLLSGSGYSPAGAGRGNVNPPFVTP